MNVATIESRDLTSMSAGARTFGLTPRRVHGLAARGKLTVVQLPGGRPMISMSQLGELVRSSTTWGSGLAG